MQRIPSCHTCQHFQEGSDQEPPFWGQCKAFPKGIPGPVWSGEDPHEEPRKGDGGLVYKPLAGAPEPEA